MTAKQRGFFQITAIAAIAAIFALASLPITGAQSRQNSPTPITAQSVRDFLDSLGANSAISARGETLQNTAASVKYLGLGWLRTGYETRVPIAALIDLHKQTGVRFSYGLLSGGADIPRLLDGAHQLAAADALVALEGPNEPNNWGIKYQGEAGGGHAPSWLPVAKLQSDLYTAVKSDPVLKKYPVWSISENGAEKDNVGLQFLTIPRDANCLMPDGTRYADCANVHNYVYHANSPRVEDNKTWNASDPGPACRVDGLYGNYGRTWAHHYAGIALADIPTLPRVTTETGTTIGGAVTEDIHALNLLSLYLDQYKRGWNHTAVYLLRDRSDEGGNQKFGFYTPNYTPRKAALYLHNLTTILADNGSVRKPHSLSYVIQNAPPTVHDLLLEKSDGTLALVVWNERVSGVDTVTIDLGKTVPTLQVYDPTVGTIPIQTVNGKSSLTLPLSDHPNILLISSH